MYSENDVDQESKTENLGPKFRQPYTVVAGATVQHT